MPALELEAIVLRAQVEGEAGDRDLTVLDDLARLAVEHGRWDLVVNSCWSVPPTTWTMTLPPRCR